MFRARTIHREPFVYAAFVVDAEAGQPRNRIAVPQVVQTDDALALVLPQNIVIVDNSWLCKTHDKMALHIFGLYEFTTHRTFDAE